MIVLCCTTDVTSGRCLQSIPPPVTGSVQVTSVQASFLLFFSIGLSIWWIAEKEALANTMLLTVTHLFLANARRQTLPQMPLGYLGKLDGVKQWDVRAFLQTERFPFQEHLSWPRSFYFRCEGKSFPPIHSWLSGWASRTVLQSRNKNFAISLHGIIT